MGRFTQQTAELGCRGLIFLRNARESVPRRISDSVSVCVCVCLRVCLCILWGNPAWTQFSSIQRDYLSLCKVTTSMSLGQSWHKICWTHTHTRTFGAVGWSKFLSYWPLAVPVPIFSGVTLVHHCATAGVSVNLDSYLWTMGGLPYYLNSAGERHRWRGRCLR